MNHIKKMRKNKKRTIKRKIREVPMEKREAIK